MKPDDLVGVPGSMTMTLPARLLAGSLLLPAFLGRSPAPAEPPEPPAASRPPAAAAGDRGDVAEPGAICWPLDGEAALHDSFGDARSGGRRSHEGVDIMAPRRTPVLAVAAGVVSWAHDDVGGRCCALEIRHEDGWRSRYIHLDNDTPGTDDGLGYGIAPVLGEGSRVARGQLVGWVGDSGNAESCDPHLHFELRRPDGTAVDPFETLVRLESLPKGAVLAWEDSEEPPES